MKLSMHEHQVLKAIAACHPVKSSYSKLAKETGMARNEIEEITGDLKKIAYLNVTPAKEVYLMEDGRKHLGISSDRSESSKVIVSPIAPVDPVTAIKLATSSPVKEEKFTLIEKAFTDLENKLSHKPLAIEELGLKLSVLRRLSVLLAPDIEKVLLSISDDLTGIDNPKDAA